MMWAKTDRPKSSKIVASVVKKYPLIFFFEGREAASEVGSDVQRKSSFCSCHIAALTHGLSVCATIFISNDKLDEYHVPEDKTACFFACGLPHLYPCVSAWCCVARSDPTRPFPSGLQYLCFAFRFSPNVSANM